MATVQRFGWIGTAALCAGLWAIAGSGSVAWAQAPATAAPTPSAGDPVRGRYLVEHVAMCVECHSDRDSSGTIIPAERFKGGPLPPGPIWAVDWPMRAPRNAGLPGYTDAEARRLLMQGAISRNGQQLRAPMPRFRMTQQDADDVIAFLRAQP
jgi:mono/diheme cytochrome c family protein